MLRPALELAQTLQKRRIEQGAVVLIQDEPEILLTGYPDTLGVQVENKESPARAQTIVSEFMILANTHIARWAQDIGLPLLFRTQNITLPSGCAGVWSDPRDIYRIVRHMGPSIMETTARRHATLGAQAYAPITSPLRRYADFMNMAQVMSQIKNSAPRWSLMDLQSMLPQLSARAEAAARVQRRRPRYWKYLAIREQGRDHLWPVVVVDVTPNCVTFSLTGYQLFLRAPRTLFGSKVQVGQHFHVRFGRVDPLENDIKIIEAVESEPPDTPSRPSDDLFECTAQSTIQGAIP
jgi:exoribonuclease-2